MDGDGNLTQLELAALLLSIGLKPTGDELHALLFAMNSNKNGTIEFKELTAAIAPMMSQQSLVDQAQLLEVFNEFDRDGNRYISATELPRLIAKMG
ncbi:putative calcium-binding protein CML14 [Carex littledalei]|uniref:Putative calcium-binding protein CML14 n=1 Tax=Carex littledalei TaxID=544730 RepID=A0A833V2K5_9POAL|nr:putative calcium-binding protein CML14 [Carex littledalei]